MPQVCLLPSQHRLFFEHGLAPEVAYIGGLGCGKSDALGVFVLKESLSYPRNYVAVAAATFPQLRRATLRSVVGVLRKYGVRFKFNKVEQRITFRNGSIVDFVSCDVPPEQLQGPEFGALAIDEGEAVSEKHWTSLAGRVRKQNTSRRIRVFSNPPHRNHWIVRHFVNGGMGPVINATTYENFFLPADVIRRYERLYPKGSLAHRRYILGEVGIPVEGAVFPEFNDRDHTLSLAEWETLQRHVKVIGHVSGMDFGFNHPFAFELAAVLDDDVLVFCGEHHAAGLGIDKHIDEVKKILQGECIFADHDAQERHEWETRGIPTTPAPKHLGVEHRIEATRRRLVTNRVKIVRELCPALYSQFQTYRWAKPKNDDTAYRDLPVKVGDDAMDAGQYAIIGFDQAGSDDLAPELAEIFGVMK